MPRRSEEYRARRRRQILDAAVSCFARRGLHHATMADIIAEAGLSAGAVYCYFVSKDEIIAAIAAERHREEAARLARLAGRDDLLAALHEFAHDYFIWLSEPDERLRRRVNIEVWAEALSDPRLAAIVQAGIEQRAPLRSALAAAQADGRWSPAIDPDVQARLLLALLQGFILQQAWQPDIDGDGFIAGVDALIDAMRVAEG